MNVIKETPGTSAAGRIKGAAPGPVHVLPATLIPRGSTAAAEHDTIWPGYEVSGFGTATTTTEAQEGYFSIFPRRDYLQDDPPLEDARAALAELRRLTDFTWGQVARLFNVDRRSIHNWVSGKRMNHRNEEHLRRLLAFTRQIDRGTASANRNMLLNPSPEGVVPFDLLAEKRYTEALASVGPPPRRPRRRPRPLSREAEKERRTEPPETRISAPEDAVHIDKGRTRPATTVRVKASEEEEDNSMSVSYTHLTLPTNREV